MTRSAATPALPIAVLLACGGCAGDNSPAHTEPPDAVALPGWSPPKVVPPAPGSAEPFMLSQTGLYLDITSKSLAPDLIEYEPHFALWSDAADKRRFLRVPAQTQVDTSDMDHWLFPVGTMLFKEFSLAGKRLETRLVMRTGHGPDDYFMGAFVWNDAESDAVYVPGGQPDACETQHDIPSTKQCLVCHSGERGRVLGVSAVQGESLPHALLTHPPQQAYELPGDEASVLALGYLHANCGHCHNVQGTAWPDTDLDLRLTVDAEDVRQTAPYRSAVAVQMTDPSLKRLRIANGDPSASGVWYRMSLRGPTKQMPPVATEQVDSTGLRLIEAWIRGL